MIYWHSVVIALLPTLAAIYLVARHRAELDGNWILVWLGIALSFIQGRPEIQGLISSFIDTPEYSARASPVFLPLYLLFGRFAMPSIAITWAGTFLCLMVTDLAYCYFQWILGPLSLGTLLSGVGGAGWMDGLFIIPIVGSAITLFVRARLRQGHHFISMVGRNKYVSQIETLASKNA